MKNVKLFLFLLLSFSHTFNGFLDNTSKVSAEKEFWYNTSDTIAAVELKLKWIKDINQTDQEGRTALHIAAADGKMSMVEFLVQNGADVNQPIKDKIENTALHVALQGKANLYVEVTNFLLKHYANPVKKNIGAKKTTPVHLITYAKNESDFRKLLQMFITSCANVNVKDYRGLSLLFWLVAENKKEFLNILQKEFGHLIDFSAKDNSKKSIIAFAKQQKGDIVNQVSPPQLPELTAAVNVNEFNANYSLNDKFTLTMVAAIQSDKKYFLDVLQEGGNPNIKDLEFGNTALHWAIKSNQPDYVKPLLEKGANPNATNLKGQTPFHFLMNVSDERKRKEVMELLIKNDGNVNIQDNNGNSMFLLTVLKAYDAFVEQIIKDSSLYAPINLNLKNKTGKTALEVLKKNKSRNKKLINLLEPLYKIGKINKTDRSGYTPTQLAAMRNDLPTLKKLLEKNPNLEIKGKDGNTALHLAIRFNNVDGSLLLLDEKFKDSKKNPKINIKNNNGNTLIHELVHILTNANRIILTSRLIEKGYNITEKNKEGNTIFHLSAKKGQTDYIIWLQEHLFDSLKNNAKQTPLDIAKNMGDNALIQALTPRG